jgi:hypothetical protein
MNRVLIVWYDLAKPEQNLNRLVQKIKSYGKWARLGNSAYLISTDVIPKTVRDNLSAALQDGDRVFVGVAARPAAWRGIPEDVGKWIVANQQQ